MELRKDAATRVEQVTDLIKTARDALKAEFAVRPNTKLSKMLRSFSTLTVDDLNSPQELAQRLSQLREIIEKAMSEYEVLKPLFIAVCELQNLKGVRISAGGKQWEWKLSTIKSNQRRIFDADKAREIQLSTGENLYTWLEEMGVIKYINVEGYVKVTETRIG